MQVYPPTPGWDRLMRRRIAQVASVEDPGLRYNAYISTITQALVAPNFTENGWALTRAPQEIVELLRENLHKNLENATVEPFIDAIGGADEDYERPRFIKQVTLNRLVLNELKSMHEEWSGVPLIGQEAYGLRIYGNQSVLNMHSKLIEFCFEAFVWLLLPVKPFILITFAFAFLADKMKTHVISSILHIDHDKDSEPWPILIEDFQGNLNEVVLESGDMLFYESSKCMHGRVKPFNGKWYSSIFVHYYPEYWVPEEIAQEGHFAVPPAWEEPTPVDPGVDRLEVVGMSFTEPDCPYAWCDSVNSIKWYGPAKEGVLITAGYKEEDGRDEL
jgi:hypothetical protein